MAIKKIIFLFIITLFIISSAFSTVIIDNRYNIPIIGITPRVTFNNTTEFLTVELYNPSPLPTEKNLQIPLNIDWNNYASLLNKNVSNVRIYNLSSAIGRTYGFGLLPAWIEFNNTTYSKNSTVWVNLENTIIPPHGEIKIYIGFLNKSVSWNKYWGLNSYLDGPNNFGLGDNGKYVFNYYNPGNYLLPLSNTGTNGKGPSLTTNGPTPFYDSITGTVNGGTADASTWTTNGITNNSSPSLNLTGQYIVQVKVYLTGTDPLVDLLTNVNSSITNGPFYVFRFDARRYVNSINSPSSYTDLIGYYPKGVTSTTILSNGNYNITTTNEWYQLTAVRNYSTLELFKNNSGILHLSDLGFEEVNTTINQSENITGGGIAITTDGASSTDYWSLLIVRNYPPDGIMPEYNFGPLNSWGEFRNKINFYEDNITTTIYPQKLVASYIGQNGVIYWVDSYGDVFVNYSNNGVGNSSNGLFELTPLRSAFPNAPFINDIAVVNLTLLYNINFIILLSKPGFVYAYNVTNSTWINASNAWNLNLNKIANDWISVSFSSSIPLSFTYVINQPLYLYFANATGSVYKFEIFPVLGSSLLRINIAHSQRISGMVEYLNNTKNKYYDIVVGTNGTALFMLAKSGKTYYWVPINSSIKSISSLTVGFVGYNGIYFNRIIVLTSNGTIYFSKQNVTIINKTINPNNHVNFPFVLDKRFSSKSEFVSVASQPDTINPYAYAFSNNASMLFAFTLNFSSYYIIGEYANNSITQYNGLQYDLLYPIKLDLFTINSTLGSDISISFLYINSTNLTSLSYVDLSYSNITSIEYFLNYSNNNGLIVTANSLNISERNNASFFAKLVPILPYNAYIRLFLILSYYGEVFWVYNVSIRIINDY